MFSITPLFRHKQKNLNLKSGFTIVELLVVIVVIGILAAISIVSYGGLTNKAVAVSLESDLTNSSDQLKIYKAYYKTFPTSLDGDNCPLLPVKDTGYCLVASSNNSYTVYESDGATFSLLETNANGIIYSVTDSTVVAAGALPVFYTLTITASAGGTVNTAINGRYTSGSTKTIIATPSANYAFSSWTGSTGCSGVASHTITMDADKSCTANFTLGANWIVVGTQIWAKANLNVGTMVTGATTQTNNSSLEKYCYSDIESNCTTYGGLYQWDEAMQYVTTEGAQGICPAGSHIPTDAEWTTLIAYFGSATAGTQFKSGGSSGLNIPLAGDRDSYGAFLNSPSNAYLWSSSEPSSNYARYVYLFSALAVVYQGTVFNGYGYGYSVRCMGN